MEMRKTMLRWAAVAVVLAAASGTAYGQAADSGGSGSPFDFTFGPQENGHLGAVLKGSQFYTLSRIDPAMWDQGRRTLFSPFAGLEIDAGWSSDPDALNNASLSFRPAFGLSRIGRRIIVSPVTQLPDTVPTTAGPWLHVYGDIRQRYGRFRPDEDTAAEQVNQTMLGAGAQIRWVSFNRVYASFLRTIGLDTGREDQPPTLSLTYYSVQSTATNLPALPTGVTANALQSSVRGDITLPLLCSRRQNLPPPSAEDPFDGTPGTIISCPLGFTGELTGTWPRGSGAEFLGDVGVYLNTGSSLRPIVRYRSGEEHGLKYDRQLLLGVIWDLVR